jgi:hypothetical protein
MRSLLLAVTAAALALVSVPAAARTPPAAAVAPSTPTADPKDVASVEAITAALYDVISGPKGRKRNWDRMRSLFRPEARLVPLVRNPTGGFDTRVLTVEDYIRLSGPRLEGEGFFERETARKEDRFQNIAHVFSAYEGRTAANGPVFLKGVNSLQLIFDGTRWWILNLAWDQARPPAPSAPG